MKILITGVHGFVGSNLVKALAPENEIYGLDIVAPEKDGVIRTYSWEDMDNGLIPEVDAIVHLAGKAHDMKDRTQAEVYFKVNTDLTIKVFDWFSSVRARKFVFFSTAKAAADKVDGVLTEDVVPSPVGPYGESKIAAEKYILGTMENHPDRYEGRGVYILRPCMIHGPGNKGNLNLLYSVVKKGIPWPLGAFENRRTFTSVDNVCYVVDGLLHKAVASGIYNMGDDEALSTNELITIICQAVGKKPRIWKISKGFMTWCAKVGDRLRLPLNSERLRKLTENYISSNQKIKSALGIESMPVDAYSGLKKTLSDFNAFDK